MIHPSIFTLFNDLFNYQSRQESRENIKWLVIFPFIILGFDAKYYSSSNNLNHGQDQ